MLWKDYCNVSFLYKILLGAALNGSLSHVSVKVCIFICVHPVGVCVSHTEPGLLTDCWHLTCNITWL